VGIGQKYVILAVDDEKVNLCMLNQILSSDYTVLIAKSGKEALKRVEREHPDLILLDIIMPDMSGFDVIDELKKSEHASKIPVIFITGLSADEDEEKGFSLGAVDYITKPFKNAIVRARVRTHIQVIDQIRTIERLGLIDPLTDIPNRRSFDRHLDIEWRRCVRDRRPISFLMMDLDKFKNYNDTYGHPQGDVLLKDVSKIFTRAARRPSDMAARLGGEEFGILLPDAELDSATAIAEKVRSEVESARISAEDGSITAPITISIGVVSTVPQKDDDAKEFIARADEYLYRAKDAGRNRVCIG
jgi:diguanylate cyclase (GGDEF)-like protein